MKTKKINDFKMLDVIPNSNLSDKLIYKDIFTIKYPTLLVVGASRSGKGELIRNILYNVMLPWETKLYILSPTVEDDNAYKRLTNVMSEFNEITYSKDPNQEFFDKIVNENNRKMNEYGCENVILFDDLSKQLRNDKDISYMSTKNRHMKSLMIVSTQTFTDLNPKLRQQATHVILFGKLRGPNLKIIFDDYIQSNFNLTEDQFIELYKQITKPKYSFMTIDILNSKIRKGLDEELDF